MAHIAQLKILQDESEKLSAIMEYVKDPKAFIASVSEDVKRVKGVTEDTEKRAAAIQATFSKNEKLLDDLKTENTKYETHATEISNREQVLKKAGEDHLKFVDNSLTSLKGKIDAHEEAKKQLAKDIELKNIAVTIAQQALQTKLAAFDKMQKEFEKEKNRVADMEKTAVALKTKYEKKLALIQADIG